MTNKMVFEETTPGVFERNKNFRIKSNRWVDEQYNAFVFFIMVKA